jgi:hypothetical protein
MAATSMSLVFEADDEVIAEWWRCSFRDNVLDALQKAYHTGTREFGTGNFAFNASPDVVQEYTNYLMENRRYTEYNGWVNIVYKGVRLFTDDTVPPDTIIVFRILFRIYG